VVLGIAGYVQRAAARRLLLLSLNTWNLEERSCSSAGHLEESNASKPSKEIIAIGKEISQSPRPFVKCFGTDLPLLDNERAVRMTLVFGLVWQAVLLILETLL